MSFLLVLEITVVIRKIIWQVLYFFPLPAQSSSKRLSHFLPFPLIHENQYCLKPFVRLRFHKHINTNIYLSPLNTCVMLSTSFYIIWTRASIPSIVCWSYLPFWFYLKIFIRCGKLCQSIQVMCFTLPFDIIKW